MTTTADALEVLTYVSLAHRKTAPKIEDREAALAIAGVWADLFSAHNLALPDLLAGVKLRAQYEAEAPEPAEIITFARKIRNDRRADEGPSPEYEALCESKSEDAAELAALRRERELAPALDRPKLAEAIAAIAGGKSVGDA